MDEAINLIEGVPSEDVAGIFDEMSAAKVVQMMGELGLPRASDIWSRMEPVKAGPVFEAAPVAWAIEIVRILPEPTLLPRLPEVSPAKLWQIPLEVLIDNLPSVPVMHLDFWNRPEVDPDLAPGVEALVSATMTVYELPEARAGGWARLVSSPAPFDAIWARFNRSRSDVRLRLDNLDGQPEGSPALPRGRRAERFFRVGLQNAEAEDIAVVAAIAFVDKSWIAANQIQKWSLQFNRLDESRDAWVPFPSKRISETDERVFFAVVVPGFSTMAITGSPDLPEQVFRVTDLRIDPESPIDGEAITVRGRVTNDGEEVAAFPADLWVNNSIEATRLLTLEPGVSAEFAIDIARPEGHYRVRVDRAVLEFDVSPAPDEPPSVGDDTLPDLALFAVAVAAALILLGGYLVAARRDGRYT